MPKNIILIVILTIILSPGCNNKSISVSFNTNSDIISYAVSQLECHFNENGSEIQIRTTGDKKSDIEILTSQEIYNQPFFRT